MIDDTLTQQVNDLVDVLEAQAADFSRLLAYIAQGEAAVRSANVTRLLEVCQEERIVAGRLSELDRHRVDIVLKLTRVFDPSQANEGPMRTADL